MIAIAENGVQSRQVCAVALDGRRGTREVRPNVIATDWSQGGASVATLEGAFLAPLGQFIAHVDNSLLGS
jgi:hypothetical protein